MAEPAYAESGCFASGVRAVILLTVGWEVLPKSWSVYGSDPTEILREPTPAVLVQFDKGYLLLDTGFNPALIRDEPLRRRFHGASTSIQAELPEGDQDPLLGTLESAGVSVEDIKMVALSHLHADHAGGIRHFAGRVPIQIQRAELDFGLSAGAERHGIYRINFDDPRIDWRLAEGDCEVAPGVTAIVTAGHTPGHQSFAVRYDKSVGGGGFVFAFDAADLTENIDGELAVGGVVGSHPSGTIEHIRKLKALASSEGLLLVPGHDPTVWPALTARLSKSNGVLGTG